MDKVTISLAPLLKVQKKFELFSAHLSTEQEKAGAIQAFEFCFELAWRTLKKVLEKQQTEKLMGPRDTIRMGALHRFIGNPA
ncbi:MAG: nucleotidyltransferase substrate binding protein [bacterium]